MSFHPASENDAANVVLSPSSIVEGVVDGDVTVGLTLLTVTVSMR